MLGAYKARVAPFNVNYRYVGEELQYLLNDAKPRAIILHSSLAPTLAEVLPTLPHPEVLLQVADDSGHPLLPGADWYEEALAASSPEGAPVEPSPDDLYILYTGGTTGMPKGVLWRQGDIYPAAMGGRQVGSWKIGTSYEGLTERLVESSPVAPADARPAHARRRPLGLLHADGPGGNTRLPRRHRAGSTRRRLVRGRGREGQLLPIVGDAVLARCWCSSTRRPTTSPRSSPSAAAARRSARRCRRSSSAAERRRLRLGRLLGDRGTDARDVRDDVRGGLVPPRSRAPCIVDETLSRVLKPGHDGNGWLAQTGNVPLGYLGDPDKTARTFPVIDGVRYSIPGDRARHRADGLLELLGRDSVTINSGGEKIFVEEVERAIAGHPAVADVVVAGRP